MLDNAISPRMSSRVGTTRQPSRSRFCAASACSRAFWPGSDSLGKNTTPTPRGLPASSESPVDASRKSRGIAVMMPTPSLLLPSAAMAPRCARRARAVRAWVRISWVGWLRRVATKPTPQESWSKRESSRLGVRLRSGEFEAKEPIRNYNPRFHDKQLAMKISFAPQWATAGQ